MNEFPALFRQGKKTGYNVFTRIKVSQLAAENNVDAKDRMKVVGSIWKNMSASEKEEVALTPVMSLFKCPSLFLNFHRARGNTDTFEQFEIQACNDNKENTATAPKKRKTVKPKAKGPAKGHCPLSPPSVLSFWHIMPTTSWFILNAGSHCAFFTRQS